MVTNRTFQPTGKHRSVFNQGKEAFRKGKAITDNPFLLNRVSFSSWWEAGFLRAKAEQDMRR